MTKSREPARRLVLRGEAARNHEAAFLAAEPGDAATVKRGRMRSIVIACPDGCGDHITINLDDQAGPAWLLYQRPQGLTLFPSVWRESGCLSHFIVWHNTILWCEAYASDNREPEILDPSLKDRVLAHLTRSFRSYVDVALELDEVPWEVGRSCRLAVHDGLVEEADEQQGHFRIVKPEASL